MKEWNTMDRFIARIRYRKVLKAVQLNPQSTVVCDIGCGRNGTFLSQISEQILEGYGFDMKTENCKVNNIHLIHTNDIQKNIPLPDNSCDIVFMIAVLEHLSDPQSLFCELSRILKPGGSIVLTTPTRLARPVLEAMAFKLHIINKEEILDHKHYYVKAEIAGLCLGTKHLNQNIKYTKFTFGMNSIAVISKKQTHAENNW